MDRAGRFASWFVIAFAFSGLLWGNVKAAPTSLSFTYQIGQTGLPAAQTVNVTPLTGNTSLSVSATTSGEPWLTVTPASGKTPLAVRVNVNPTTLVVGSYAAVIALTATDVAGAQPVSVPLSLVVKAAPSNLSVTPASLTFTWRRGDAAPAAKTLAIGASGGVLSYTVAVAGGAWLTADASSGIVFSGFPDSLSVSVAPSDLAPGAFKGTVTVTAPASANKSVKVDVNLTVQPGAAKVASVWPQKIVAGAPDTTVTITGSNFYTGTTVSAGQSAPKTTILGSTALTAVLPASLLATAGTITLAAANPDPGGGTTGTVTFTVAATGPQIASVVNSASYATGPVAPGEVVTIFGSGLGPDTLAVFTAVNNVIPTDLDSTRVTFGTTAAPVIYTSATQVAAVAPFGLDTTAPVTLKVAYNSVDSALLPVLTAAAAPGIFTFTGTGAGQAAALNYDETKKEYSINSDTAPATKGSILIFYATGTGKPAQPPADGTIPQQAATANEASISVQIGGVDVTVIYAGAAPGLVAGMMQVNVRVPDTVTTNKAATLTLKSGAIASPAGVTVSVK